MARGNRYRWALFCDRTKPDVQGGHDIVGAISNHDEAALTQALSQYPGCGQDTRLWWTGKEDKKYRLHNEASPAQAALRENWGPALPILQRAGVQFTSEDVRAALRLHRFAGVRFMIQHGADPHGDPDRPHLYRFDIKDIRPEKWKPALRGMQALLDHGANPWGSCPRSNAPQRSDGGWDNQWTVVEHHLSEGHVGYAQLLLDHAIANRLPYPALEEDPERFWMAYTQGVQRAVKDEFRKMMELWNDHFVDIAQKAQHLGVGLTTQRLMHVTDFYFQTLSVWSDPAHAGRMSNGEKRIVAEFFKFAQRLVDVLPHHQQAQATHELTQKLLPHSSILPGEMLAHWQQKDLALNTHTPSTTVSRMRL